MSFLITESGSYGFPRKLDPFSTSHTAFEILCQKLANALHRCLAACRA
jgi:hypothetical protein